MRESLLETFDEIYVLNLHGSSKKQETAPDGTKDDNVFDITVGVAIALFVKLPPGSQREGADKTAKKGRQAQRHRPPRRPLGPAQTQVRLARRPQRRHDRSGPPSRLTRRISSSYHATPNTSGSGTRAGASAISFPSATMA